VLGLTLQSHSVTRESPLSCIAAPHATRTHTHTHTHVRVSNGRMRADQGTHGIELRSEPLRASVTLAARGVLGTVRLRVAGAVCHHIAHIHTHTHTHSLADVQRRVWHGAAPSEAILPQRATKGCASPGELLVTRSRCGGLLVASSLREQSWRSCFSRQSIARPPQNSCWVR
jgi:hypothetical protein